MNNENEINGWKIAQKIRSEMGGSLVPLRICMELVNQNIIVTEQAIRDRMEVA